MRKFYVSATFFLIVGFPSSQIFSKESKAQKSQKSEAANRVDETCHDISQKLARLQIQMRTLSDEEKESISQYRKDLEMLSCPSGREQDVEREQQDNTP